MSKTPKVTPWFPADVKPARIGVYERRTPGGGEVDYSFWDGLIWHGYGFDVEHAARHQHHSYETCFVDDEWRGLAENPAPGAAPGAAE